MPPASDDMDSPQKIEGKPVLTPGEAQVLTQLATKTAELRSFLTTHPTPSETSESKQWYAFFAGMKDLLGNLNNDLSFVATILAKQFLSQRHGPIEFDASTKSQSAPGLDIDFESPSGRIVGEVKTVYPYNETDFGATQRDAFLGDFEKLRKATAAYKYLFVTEPRAFDVISKKYRGYAQGITVVSLRDGRELVVDQPKATRPESGNTGATQIVPPS